MEAKQKQVAELIGDIQELLPAELIKRVKAEYTPEQLKYLVSVFLIEVAKLRAERGASVIEESAPAATPTPKVPKKKKLERPAFNAIASDSAPEDWAPEDISAKQEKEKRIVRRKRRIDFRA